MLTTPVVSNLHELVHSQTVQTLTTPRVARHIVSSQRPHHYRPVFPGPVGLEDSEEVRDVLLRRLRVWREVPEVPAAVIGRFVDVRRDGLMRPRGGPKEAGEVYN